MEALYDPFVDVLVRCFYVPPCRAQAEERALKQSLRAKVQEERERLKEQAKRSARAELDDLEVRLFFCGQVKCSRARVLSPGG